MPIFFRCFIVFSLCITAGCGRSDRPQLAQVAGTVTYNGTPLEKGTIVFESTGNRPANGEIENGKIVRVMTFEDGDGVPVGIQNIAVFALAVADSATASDPSQDVASGENYMGGSQSLIPDKYTNPATSGLSTTIEAGQTNEVKLELTSAE